MPQRLQVFSIFCMKAISSLAISTLNVSKESLMKLNKTAPTLHYKIFSLKIRNKFCYNRLIYCKFMQKRNKAKGVMKKDHSRS